MTSPGQRGSDPRLTMILVITVVCLTTGCAKQAASSKAPVEYTPPPLRTQLPEGYSTEVNELDAVDFAKRFERVVEQGDKETLNRLIDWDLMMDRACAGLPLPEVEIEDAKIGMIRRSSGRSDSSGGFVPELLQGVSGGASFSFVSTDEKDGVRRVLFRMFAPDEGLNYLRCTVVRDQRDTIVVSDVYPFASAQSLCEAARWVTITLIVTRFESAGVSRTGSERETVALAKTMHNIGKARVRGDYAEIMRLQETLPKKMRRSKACLVNRILAAQEVDEKEWLAAIEEFKACYPGNGSLALLMIGYYTTRQEYDKALESVETLDAEVDDPYLNLVRATIHSMKQDSAAAKRYVDTFITDFPQLIDGYELRATIALGQRDFPAVTKALKVLHREFGVDPVALTNLPCYAPYKKSEEYDRLKEYLEMHIEIPTSANPALNPQRADAATHP